MKLVSVLLFALVSQTAFADLTCDAHEIMAGDAGRTGTVNMGQSPFSLKWNGDSNDLIGKGTLCGVALSATTICRTIDHSRGPTIAARMMCSDSSKGPYDNQIGEGYFAYSEVNGTGRFGCTSTGGQEKVSKLVEISNCR